MYPTLYHALLDLTGIDWPWLKMMNSFGFFVALAFLTANYLLFRELKRKEEQGLFFYTTKKITEGKPASIFDFITSGTLGFVIGYKFLYIFLNRAEVFADGNLPQKFLLSLEGNLIGGLVLAAAFLFMRYRESEKDRLPEPIEKIVFIKPSDRVGSITIVAALFGFLGAKIFAGLEDPNDVLSFFRRPSVEGLLGGLAIYGGLIGGGLALIIYTRKHKISPLHFMDALAPGVMLSYGIGRIGCHVSGDGDWGIANTNPCPSWVPEWLWAYSYPNNVNVVSSFNPKGGYTGKNITNEMIESGIPSFPGYGTYLEPAVYPTPLYELALATIIFLILWRLRSKVKFAGSIIAIYFIFNGIERFFIEKIRVNDFFDLGFMTITQAEIIALCFVLFGVILLLLIRSGKIPAPKLPTKKEIGVSPSEL